MSQLFASGGQSIRVSASTSVLPMNTQNWSPLGWTGWISLQSESLLQHYSSKASIFQHSAFFVVQLSYPYMITGKTIALTRWTFVAKVMSLLFNMLSRLVIKFLPRSKHLKNVPQKEIRGWTCNVHVADHTPVTWHIMHWSRGTHALITWLSCTAHVADHAMIT